MSKTMRALGQIPDTQPKWIILDGWKNTLETSEKFLNYTRFECIFSGDLDANWIESMNSVMDDNRLLTLPSNERIPLKPHMR